MERFTFFWGKQDVFSQWHPASFEFKTRRFSCAEQAMMWCKAVRFGDMKIAEKVLKETDPKIHKELGRQVEGFDKQVWDKESLGFVKEINRCKFSQNPALKQKLLDTAGTSLSEASPFDKIWGIGLRASDSRALDRTKWKGKNHLGEILTELRKEFEQEL